MGLSSCFNAITPLFWLLWLCNMFWIQECEASIFVLAIKIALALWGSLWFPTYFKKEMSLSIKCHWISVRCCSESVHHFGWYGNLNNIGFQCMNMAFHSNFVFCSVAKLGSTLCNPKGWSMSWSLLKFMAIELMILSFQFLFNSFSNVLKFSVYKLFTILGPLSLTSWPFQSWGEKDGFVIQGKCPPSACPSSWIMSSTGAPGKPQDLSLYDPC